MNKLPEYITNQINFLESITILQNTSPPLYNPLTHQNDLIDSAYYSNLLKLRHILKLSCDYFWSVENKSVNVDLFMLYPFH